MVGVGTCQASCNTGVLVGDAVRDQCQNQRVIRSPSALLVRCGRRGFEQRVGSAPQRGEAQRRDAVQQPPGLPRRAAPGGQACTARRGGHLARHAERLGCACIAHALITGSWIDGLGPREQQCRCQQRNRRQSGGGGGGGRKHHGASGCGRRGGGFRFGSPTNTPSRRGVRRPTILLR